MTNRLDLFILISLKIIFCYVAYQFFTNTLGLAIFEYPDMAAYKDCIETDGIESIIVNVLYSEFLCSIGMNYEAALSEISLIVIACVINLISICLFYIIFKDFLSRNGQIFFILLLAFHPYMAIYFPRFYTDVFGSLGILLICYYSIQNIKINYIFVISALILINFRASLMPPLFLFIAYNFFIEYKKENRFNLLMFFTMCAIAINFLLYRGFADMMIQTVTNFYSNKIYNIVFLLGFREAIANEGFSIFLNGSLFGYVQLFISLFLLLMHSIGIFSMAKFAINNKFYGIMASLAVIVVPLITISHMRYLLPLIPLIMFGFSWYFFRKE